MIHGKLVRDNIPGIIRDDGYTPDVIKLTNEEFSAALIEKLREETDELDEMVSASKGTDRDCSGMIADEIADILEVLDYIICDMELDSVEINQRRERKLGMKGGFVDKLYLVRVS